MSHAPSDMPAPFPTEEGTGDQMHAAAWHPQAVDAFHTPSPWPASIKFKRVLWAAFRPLFVRGTGRHFSALRVAALRLFGAQIDRPVLIMDGVKVWHPWALTMHRHSTLGRGVEVYNFAHITVGEQATISQETFLCTASHDFEDPRLPLIFHPIEIGAQAWVAARCFVGPGVVIGEGAVVGACSVVTRNVDPWTVAAGNPARALRPRRLKPALRPEAQEHPK